MRGRIKNLSWEGGKLQVTLELTTPQTGLESLQDCDLDISIDKHREKRSKNANALLWACIGEMAEALRADKWEVYLQMLRRYGQYTYICVKPQAVEAVKRQWRESEELGEILIGGQKAVQMLCYYGSSTYDSKEFSALLDGVISEMKEIGLQPPMPEEVKRAIEAWEKTMGTRAG